MFMCMNYTKCLISLAGSATEEVSFFFFNTAPFCTCMHAGVCTECITDKNIRISTSINYSRQLCETN